MRRGVPLWSLPTATAQPSTTAARRRSTRSAPGSWPPPTAAPRSALSCGRHTPGAAHRSLDQQTRGKGGYSPILRAPTVSLGLTCSAECPQRQMQLRPRLRQDGKSMRRTAVTGPAPHDRKGRSRSPAPHSRSALSWRDSNHRRSTAYGRFSPTPNLLLGALRRRDSRRFVRPADTHPDRHMGVAADASGIAGLQLGQRVGAATGSQEER